jgi:hypothetical protein
MNLSLDFFFLTEVFLQLKDTTERIKSVDAAAALVEEMMKQGLPSAGTVQNGWVSIIVILRSQVMHLQIQ